MKLASLVDGLGAERVDALGTDPSVDAVTIDSRRVKPGTVFVACPGATPSSKDGHAFLDVAVAAGASAVVITDRSKAPSLAGAVPTFVVDDARRAAAIMAERVVGSPSSKLKVVGITGTNGKTTSTWLVAQLAQQAGLKSAVIGTLGVGPVDNVRSSGFTTPEAETISQELARLVDEGVQVVAMEVSSIALSTKRVDGIRFACAAFTNLTRDHLDFHGSMEAYFDAKARLFTDLAPACPAIVPASSDDDGWHEKLRALRPDASTWATTSTSTGATYALTEAQQSAVGTKATLRESSNSRPVASPLLGAYNVENLVVAAACARAIGIGFDDVARGLSTAVAPPGRLERVNTNGAAGGGPLVVVDYAHSPDALERALHVMRGVTSGKLVVVFGCGGDRDPGKRPIMGRIAAEVADVVVVTDDNPRSENGDDIARAIESGIEIGIGDKKRRVLPPAPLDRGTYAIERARRMAIRAAIDCASDGDTVLVAGKGHERDQTIGKRVQPFDDVAECRRALRHQSSPAFLDATLVEAALKNRNVVVHGKAPAVLLGVSTDSRAVEKQSVFVALKGERFDAHEFVAGAFARGAGAAIVERLVEVDGGHGRPQFVVDDALLALQDLARAYVATLPGRRVALTGSNGKTTTKELIAACLRAAYGAPYVVATEGNLNNHIGVPLTALRCEPEHRALVFEMGMNHLEEIALLADIVKPEVGLITNIGTAHQGNVGGVEGVAQAKAELFEALPSTGVAVVNADDPRCVREAQAKAKCKHVSFGKAPWSDVKLVAVTDRESGGQDVSLECGGRTVDVAIPLEGRHNAQNAAGAVAVAVALGLPFDVAARGLPGVHVAHGRLERRTLDGNVWLLDDTYNANPDSMEAALDALADLAGKGPSARRKIVVLGEMRELGSFAEAEHRHIGAAAAQAGAALLFSCGDLGRLYGEGAAKQGLTADQFAWAADNATLSPLVVDALKDGDVVLIKGSRGARMEVVVDALMRARRPRT